MATQLELKLNTGARQEVASAVLKAVQDAFVLDIKPKAQELSPVTKEGLDYNKAKHPHWPLIKVGGTGNNRRSIDVTVTEVEKGVEASLFTQSGYGGWLETGTSRMRPQPYLWPAFRMFASKIADTVRTIING